MSQSSLTFTGLAGAARYVEWQQKKNDQLSFTHIRTHTYPCLFPLPFLHTLSPSPVSPRYLRIVRSSIGTSIHISIISIGADDMDARIAFRVFAKQENTLYGIPPSGEGVVITGEAQCRFVMEAGGGAARVADMIVQWNAAELVMKLLAADARREREVEVKERGVEGTVGTMEEGDEDAPESSVT